MEFLHNIWQLLSSFMQFFSNAAQAFAILFSTVLGALPFTLELVNVLPGIIGSSILITVAVKLIELMVKAMSGVTSGGGG